ncbi:MAG: hypothetical protein MUO77_16555, partial [Anaerolineales bacterium]|nr:hypothetical protein [Anaerolineales bacterium]
MTIKVSAYDFFSYTVPGSLYIFTIVYILKIIGYINIDFSNFDPSLIQTIIIIGVAYVIGYIFEPIAKVWSLLFRPKDFHTNIINEFKYKHPNVEIKFLASDWPILLAFIRQNNDEIVGNIEKDNATNLMLRGISLCFIVLSIIQIVQFFYGLFLPHLIIA